ncbi:hypothetical protein [Pseudoalteromonas xiamenensis]
MLNTLSLYLIFILLFQVIFMLNGRPNPYSGMGHSEIDVTFWLSILILVSYNVYYYFLSRRFDGPLVDYAIVEDRKGIVLFSVAVLLFSYFSFSNLPEIGSAMTLNGSQRVQNVGFLFKLGTTIIPALVFSMFTLYPKNMLSFSSFILGTLTCSLIGATFLTKQPILPFILFLAVQFKYSSSLIRLSIIFLLFLLLFSVFFVYTTRGEEGSLFILVDKVIFRFSLLNETQHILTYLSSNQPLYFWDFKYLLNVITSKVFGYDSNYIGLAPGYVGFFILNLGVLGFILMFFFALLINFLLSRLRSPNLYERFVYYLIVCEMLSFYIDGNPTFVYSTSNNLFFYFVIGLVFLVFLYSRLKRTATFQKRGTGREFSE